MSTKTFRVILTASLVVPIITIAIHMATFHSMPLAIQSFVHAQPVSMASAISLSIAGLIAVAISIVAYVGLYTWRSWARTLYLVLAICNVLMMALGRSPAILSSLVACLLTIGNILTGVIIAVVYFDPEISERFATKRMPNHSVEDIGAGRAESSR